MKGRRHGQTGKNEAGGVEQRIAYALATAEGTADQQLQAFPRIFANHPGDQTGHQQGGQQIEYRQHA
jgi:hypothetical protein